MPKEKLRVFCSWHQWFMPVILVTQEAEIRRIMVKAGPTK
jgi:hypothetical protein